MFAELFLIDGSPIALDAPPAVHDGSLATVRGMRRECGKSRQHELPEVFGEHPESIRKVLFGDWTDSDHDCRNTRAEILAARSQTEATGTCTIKTGRWLDPYTGRTFDSAKALEIDHLIPVAEAYRSGAWKWTQAQRVAFYNDTSLLVIASATANATKRDKDPSQWLPPDTTYSLEYIQRWARGKRTYGLTADAKERKFLAKYLPIDSLPVAQDEKRCGL